MRPIFSAVAARLVVAAVASSSLLAVSQTGFAQDAPLPPAATPAPDQVKQIPLTEAQIQHFLAARKDISALLDAMPDNSSSQPDTATLAKLDAIAKKNGFASGTEYQTVADNIDLVIAGIDPQTKKYIGADGVIKQQIEQVKGDKTMKPKDKSDMLEQLGEDLKETTPVQNKGNIDLVTKYFDQLGAAMSQD